MTESQIQKQIIITLIQLTTPNKVQAEYRFHPVRKWRFDYAIPDLKIAIEIEGAVFQQGRHTRGVGYIKDMEKYNTAVKMGWKVLRYTPQQINNIVDDLKDIV